MKDIIVICIILSLLTGGSLWTHSYYEKTKDKFEKYLKIFTETIEQDIDKEEKIKELENFWKSREDILIIFQEHDAIDEIEEHLYECIHYYKINEKNYFNLAKENLLRRMEDLVKREHLKLVNLF